MASEKLEDTTTSYVNIDLSKAGDFSVFHEAMFYDDDEALHYYEDTFKAKEGAKVKTGAKKRKRPETEDPGGDEAVEGTPEPAKRGRPRKKPRGEEDGGISIPPKKRGRPRKHPMAEEGDEASTVPKVLKRRGRLPRQKPDAEQAVCRAEVLRSESMEGVNDIVLAAQVLSPPPPETSGHPPESPGMNGVASYRQGMTSTTSHVVPEPSTSSPRERSNSFQESSDLSSSAVHEDPGDEHRRIRQAGADGDVQTAVPHPSDGVAPMTDNNDVTESHSGLVDVYAEGLKSRRSRKKSKPTIRENDASSSHKRGTVVAKGLPSEDSNYQIEESEVVGIPQQVVNGARADGLLVTDNRSSPQEPVIIDPALLGTSSVSEHHV
jgi:hypothetical protein